MLNRKYHLKGLAQRLVTDGLLEASIAQQATFNAAAQKTPLVDYLITHKMIEPKKLAYALADDFGVPLLDLDALEINQTLIESFGIVFIEQYHVLPIIYQNGYLYLAMSDPTRQKTVDEIKHHTGFLIQPVVVEEDKLSKIIQHIIQEKEQVLWHSEDDVSLLEDVKNSHAEADNNQPDLTNASLVERFVDQLLIAAVRKKASDIHFECYAHQYRIRLRQDGLLYELKQLPLVLANRITARLKVMSQLDVSERRLPQDGRFKLTIDNLPIDFRINSCPVIDGEKIVVRILDPAIANVGIDTLGLDINQQQIFLQTLKKSQGMIIVTGPTGSGKTVSLYTALQILNTTTVNIASVEDPVEIHLSGINQVSINPKTGLDFASALRAFLRQDPDIIMIGEMRDSETAEIAIKAAQTGHLVLTTLHANNAIEALLRLKYLGILSYHIATSVSLIIAQRLVRKLCGYCKIPLTLSSEILSAVGFNLEDFASLQLYSPKGCERCTKGYQGRTGIYEFLVISETLRQVILTESSVLEITKKAQQEGMQMLRSIGLAKVGAGITSLEELERVIG